MLLGTQDRDFFPKDLVEKLTFAKEMGFECFEIDGKVLMEQKDELKEKNNELQAEVQRLKKLLEEQNK